MVLEAEYEDNRTQSDKSPADENSNSSLVKLQEDDLETVSVLKIGEEDEDKGIIQKIEEDWRLTESALTEETDSLETLDTVEMTDTDLNEEMDAEDCDAGEAMADTDGLSVGDISVNGGDVEAERENNVKNGGIQKQCNDEEQGDCTADDLTESLSEELLNSGGLQEEKEDLYYIEDNINKHFNLKNNASPKQTSVNIDGVTSYRYKKNAYELPGNSAAMEQTDCVSSEVYVEISGSDKSSDENKLRTCQYRMFERDEEYKVPTAEGFSNHLDCQPRFRLVSISVPTDTSPSSSLSESQLLFPNDSDTFGDNLEAPIVQFDLEQDFNDEHVYEEPGRRSAIGVRSGSMSQRVKNDLTRHYKSGFGHSGPSSSPMLVPARHAGYQKPHYLSLYPRSMSMEGQERLLCLQRDADGSPMSRRAMFSTGSFSQHSPLSSSGLSTPTSVVDIPPPFELAYITKKPIAKSSPSLLIETDSSEKNRKKKSSIKRFLMLKFRRKTDSKKQAGDVSPSPFNSESSQPISSRLLDLERHSLTGSPQLNSRSLCKPQVSPDPSFLLYDSKRKGNSVSFLNRSVVRVESFEDRSRVPFTPLPLTKPRSISFPNTDTSDYENVPAISPDYENLQVPQQRPTRQGPFANFFDRPSRLLSSANETDGYVDMSSLPGFETKSQETER